MLNKKFLFVGSRFGVLEYMLKHRLDTTILLPKGKNHQILQTTKHQFFHNKKELIDLIARTDFDILVSNGCPYILPVSKLKQKHQIFINLHPSLLPNLKGSHPINGAILFSQKTGATCHIMNDDIDGGDIISQVEVHNDENIDLPLLYQLCFLAEIQAFKKALEHSFVPQSKNTNQGSYFSRTDKMMFLDFNLDCNQTIISKVRAFGIKGQYAKLNYDNKIYLISSAKKLNNPFLKESFQDSPDNIIVMCYEDFILIKRKDIFLELKIVDGAQDFCVGKPLIQHNKSIYQTPQYSSCLSQHQFKFEFQKNNQYFYNLSEISRIPNTNFNDMSSPYGYSGYFTNSLNPLFIKEALAMQSKQAQHHNIIAEFIRFNPYQNHQIFSNFLDFYTLEKQMVEVDTNYQKRWDGYQSRLRGKIRKSLSMLQISQSNNLDRFFKLYTQTMQRNQAQEFYFFSQEYFQKLSKLKGFVMFEALYENQTCAMAIFLIDGNRSYYHLGANSTATLANNLNAMGAIFETFFQYAEAKGVVSCLLGGGRTTSPNDTLLQYKKQYSPTLVDFYIGGKIYDYQAYQELSKKSTNKFFLKYRYTIGGGVDYK